MIKYFLQSENFFFPDSMSHELADKINEGKTKIIFALKNVPGLVLIQSKNRITAGDGARAHDMEGKAAISTSTTSDIFKMLNNAGKMFKLPMNRI